LGRALSAAEFTLPLVGEPLLLPSVFGKPLFSEHPYFQRDLSAAKYTQKYRLPK